VLNEPGDITTTPARTVPHNSSLVSLLDSSSEPMVTTLHGVGDGKARFVPHSKYRIVPFETLTACVGVHIRPSCWHVAIAFLVAILKQPRVGCSGWRRGFRLDEAETKSSSSRFERCSCVFFYSFPAAPQHGCRTAGSRVSRRVAAACSLHRRLSSSFENTK